MPEIGVVLVDDHPIVLFGLIQLFVREPGIAVLAACTRGAEALAAVACRRPEVLLLDVSLPDRNGIEMLPEIAAVSPGTRTVIFAAAVEDERVVAALNAGARAVVLKDTSASELVACIRQVAAGGKWMMADAVGVPRRVADQRQCRSAAIAARARNRRTHRARRPQQGDRLGAGSRRGYGQIAHLQCLQEARHRKPGRPCPDDRSLAGTPRGSGYVTPIGDDSPRASVAKLELECGPSPS
jgi:DNA-binding NarL/FixJ family response regulator